MKFTAFIQMINFITDEIPTPHMLSHEFWKYIVPILLEESTDFEIRCWSHEHEALKLGQSYGERIENKESMEVVYRGKMTPEVCAEIMSDFLNPSGAVKWFTISFSKDGQDLIWCEHYGTNIVLCNVSETRKLEIDEYLYKFPAEIQMISFYDVSQASE